MSAKPAELVSVILPSYRPGKDADAAIDSILAQDYRPLELIVVDDSGSGAVARHLEGREDHGEILLVLVHDRNRGPSAALNTGIRHARGTLLAIMHDDDLAAPDRLSRQVEFLDRHPEIGIVGSYQRIIDERGAEGGLLRFPVGPAGVFYGAFFAPPFGHSTVMMRTDLLRRLAPDGYDATKRATEDYALWAQLLLGTRGANLPACLVRYRYTLNDLRVDRLQEQMAEHTEIMHEYWSSIAPELTPDNEVLRHVRRVCVGGEDEMPEARFALPITRACCTALMLTREQGFTQEEMAEPKKMFRRQIGKVLRSLAHPARRPIASGRVLLQSSRAYLSSGTPH